MRILYLIFFLLIYYPAISQINEDEDLVVFLPFDNNITDISLYKNSVENNGAILSLDRFGNESSALYFNGVDSYINIKNGPHLNFGQSDFTISFWLKYPSQYGGRDVFAKRAYNYANIFIKSNEHKYPYRGITFFVDYPNKGEICFRTSATHELIYPAHDIYNQWNYFVLRRQSSELTIFLNGKKVISTLYPQTNVSNAADIRIGANHMDHLSQNFQGTLDELKIYKRALEDTEINNPCH